MEDFKFKSFQWLFNERKSRPVTLDGGFNAKKAEAPMVEQEPKVESAECKPKEAVADKPNKAKSDGVDKQTVVKRESYKKSVFKTKAQLAHFPIPYGVYIEDVYGSIHSVEKWDKENSDIINSVLVYLYDEILNDSFKFRMALNAKRKGVDDGRQYCEGFVFPDKETHGRIPDKGEMCLLILHEAQINGALNACGGDMFHNTDNNAAFIFDNVIGGKIGIGSKKDDDKYVFRPFADVELKTPTEKKTNVGKKKTHAVKKESKSASTASVKNGVYIQDVNGKLWKTEDWDGSVKPNAIAVITPQHKFRIALTQISSAMSMSYSLDDPWEIYLSGTNQTTAKADYNGAVNTQLIVTKYQSSTTYAAGACNAYTFPDGTTKGYLPALGELYLAYNNIDTINSALSACGGTTIPLNAYHWSSTFYGSRGRYRCCWILRLIDGFVYDNSLLSNRYVRAFATFEI